MKLRLGFFRRSHPKPYQLGENASPSRRAQGAISFTYGNDSLLKVNKGLHLTLKGLKSPVPPINHGFERAIIGAKRHFSTGEDEA
jgi:hypothetical protein